MTRFKVGAYVCILGMLLASVGTASRPSVATEKICFSLLPDDTTQPWLQHIYEYHNSAFFDGKLPKDTEVLFSEDATGPNNMGYTRWDGTHWIIAINPKYTLAPKVAEEVMLHEECHVTHGILDPTGAFSSPHGRGWQLCMAALDREGAFEEMR